MIVIQSVMKKILQIIALMILVSCVKESETTQIMISSVSIEEDVIYVTQSGVQYFMFTVFPADAEFSYNVYTDDCQVSLSLIKSNLTTMVGIEPENYRLHEVVPVDKGKGLYRGSILDRNIFSGYVDSVALKITYRDGKSGKQEILSEPFEVRFSGISMNSMSLRKENNPEAVMSSLSLEKSADGFRIASPLINSPELVMSFDSNGAKVMVDGVEQVSGQTVNDFSNPVTYRVIDADGKYKEFKVSVIYSGLPVLFIDTPSGLIVPDKHSDWLAETRLTLYNSDWTIDYEGTAGIRGRGNNTWKHPKKPYAIKLDSKAEILGMPKHKRWVLLANWLDRTLLRNRVSFKLSEMTGLAYTPRGRFVEVYLNGNHMGNYYLCEQIKVDDDRVSIDELTNDEVDGGYLLELDSYYDEDFKFTSDVRSLPYQFKDPDLVNASQFEYIRNYVNNMETSLYSSERFAAREYLQYIDVDSFIDWWFVQELSGNEESKHPKSVYMYKDKGGKLTMGPAWDYDWKTFRPHTEFKSNKHLYYDRLFQDPEFKARVKERWNLFRSAFQTIPDYIDAEADAIRNSEVMNHALWPITQNTNGDINLTFDEAVARMKMSYSDKMNWMDRTINAW